jgi:hypothetical protein
MARHLCVSVALGGFVALSLGGCAPVDPADGPATDAPQLRPDLPVGTSTDISLFTDVPAASSEATFRRLGYAVVRRDGAVTAWRNGRTGACAEVTVSGGTITSVEMLPRGAC